jgi:subtilisin-like proprotein convertase family protein
MRQGNRRAWLLVGAVAGVLLLAFAGIAGGKIKTKTFSSGEIDRFIPDTGGDDALPHTFNIKTKRSKVKDVNVAIRISHTSNADLLITLTGPNGNTVKLSSFDGLTFFEDDFGSGAENCNGTFTVFNDEAETSINDGSSPYNGQFTPQEPLSAFDGSKLKGKWTLTVEDQASGDDGVLHCAELEVKYRKKKKHHH